MSAFRDVWAKALRANQALALRQPGAEALFERLISEHPNDGMVFYERGEAFEYLGDLNRAEADYKQAASLFPLPHWKDVATNGVRRVEDSRQGRGRPAVNQPPNRWDVFHLVHLFPRVRHEFRVGALSAIQRIDSEPGSCGADLRLCVEEIKREAAVKHLSVPRGPASALAIVRRFGNKGAHEYRDVRPHEIDEVLVAFAVVLKWAGRVLWGT